MGDSRKIAPPAEKVDIAAKPEGATASDALDPKTPDMETDASDLDALALGDLDLGSDDDGPVSQFVLEPVLTDAPPIARPPSPDVQDDGIEPAARRIEDLARHRSSTDAMVGTITEQLSRIIDDDYDFRVLVRNDEDNIHVQKLTMFINLLLENVRRSFKDLRSLTQELEEKVEERSQVLDLVISGSSDGVWIWDIKAHTIQFSARWYDSLGISPSSCATLEEWVALVHPDDRDRLQSSIRTHLQGLTHYLREKYRIRHGDGTYRWMWCRGRCQRDAAGRTVLMAGTQTDIHEQNSIDRWTGLPNEDAVTGYLDGLIASKVSFGLLLIGLPKFRQQQEDLPMAALAQQRAAVTHRLSMMLPYQAFLARIPGEFYMVVLPTDGDVGAEVREIAAKLFVAFTETIETRDNTVVLDLVIGAVAPALTAATTSQNVMADVWTSYRAARQADVSFNMLTEAQVTAARHKASTEELVRAALENDWFVPFFQPIVDVRTLKVCGFEVLARLHHPEDGVLPTANFIDVAQDMGAMPAITRVMLDKALDTVAEWQRKGGEYASLFVSVNIDAKDIIEREFLGWLEDGLKRRRLAGWLLAIELRESSLVGNLAAASDKIARLRDLGVKIALDDFGTGYSSLTYLNQLDVDWIKVDRSFVAGLRSDGRKRSMVRMISILADQIGAQVCVDGVENEDQIALLRELSVDLYQGFIFGKPMSKADTKLFLENAEQQTGR